MTVTYMEVRRSKRDNQRRLELDKGLRDGLADLFRHRWPSGTAKHAAREYQLTLDQSRGVVAGKASLTSLEQVIKTGGWPVVFHLMGEVIGQTAEQYIIEARNINEERGQRLASLVSSIRALGSSSDPDSNHLGGRQDQRRRSFSR